MNKIVTMEGSDEIGYSITVRDSRTHQALEHHRANNKKAADKIFDTLRNEIKKEHVHEMRRKQMKKMVD